MITVEMQRRQSLLIQVFCWQGRLSKPSSPTPWSSAYMQKSRKERKKCSFFVNSLFFYSIQWTHGERRAAHTHTKINRRDWNSFSAWISTYSPKTYLQTNVDNANNVKKNVATCMSNINEFKQDTRRGNWNSGESTKPKASFELFLSENGPRHLKLHHYFVTSIQPL